MIQDRPKFDATTEIDFVIIGAGHGGSSGVTMRCARGRLLTRSCSANGALRSPLLFYLRRVMASTHNELLHSATFVRPEFTADPDFIPPLKFISRFLRYAIYKNPELCNTLPVLIV